MGEGIKIFFYSRPHKNIFDPKFEIIIGIIFKKRRCLCGGFILKRIVIGY
jgi:hypothetical protein